MNYKHLFYSFLLIFLSINVVTAQKDRQDDIPAVKVKARAKNGEILLRWAVNNKHAWKYGNAHGYIIDRTTVLRDGKPLKTPEKKRLTPQAIKPRPLYEWETLVGNNDMAAVAAQAIYGLNFEMDEEVSNNKILRVMQESEVLDRRFGFSLFAIDQDFEVAVFAGLAYVDKNVKPNEKYLYRISAAVPAELLHVEEAGVFIGPSEEEDLPIPIDFVGYYHKNSFVLVWEYDLLLPYYTSYNIERSDDGISFVKINEVPVTKLADTKTSGISYTDSITQLNKKYWYRIVGISSFSERSKPSKPITLIAYDKIKSTPVFKESVIISQKEAELHWSFPTEEEPQISQFELFRAEKAIGPYEKIQVTIAPSERSHKFGQLSSINYFKLHAKARQGEGTVSSPIMVQPVDSVPPVKPQKLVGAIDSLGIVQLSWAANEEADLKGYKIFRADGPNQEFTVRNKYSETGSSYIDTVNLRSFHTKVYYKIMALDHRYNESAYSDVLILQRPDKIPPTSPVFDTYRQEGNTVYVKWIKSSSDDVAKELIYRKQMGVEESMWEKIYETKSDTTSYFMDDNNLPGAKYLYTLVAVDHGGLESAPAPPLSIDMIKTLIKPPVKGLYATVDRQRKMIHLFWNYKEPEVHEFLIYKKKKGQAYRLFRTAKADQKQLLDIEVHPNTTYRYGVKAVFNDGSVSKWVEQEVVY